jgi:hypothetical protein
MRLLVKICSLHLSHFLTLEYKYSPLELTLNIFLVKETGFHTHAKQQVKLRFYVT